MVDLAGSGFAEHAEAVVADGVEVGAAGDEGDFLAGFLTRRVPMKPPTPPEPIINTRMALSFLKAG